jgi:hypothetical protein
MFRIAKRDKTRLTPHARHDSPLRESLAEAQIPPQPDWTHELEK